MDLCPNNFVRRSGGARIADCDISTSNLSASMLTRPSSKGPSRPFLGRRRYPRLHRSCPSWPSRRKVSVPLGPPRRKVSVPLGPPWRKVSIPLGPPWRKVSVPLGPPWRKVSIPLGPPWHKVSVPLGPSRHKVSIPLGPPWRKVSMATYSIYCPLVRKKIFEFCI